MKKSNQQLATLGIEARQVLDNPAFEEAFVRMSETISQAWRACDVRDREGALLLLQQAKLVDRIKGTLVGMIEHGKLAQAHIDINDVRDESRVRRGVRAFTGR